MTRTRKGLIAAALAALIAPAAVVAALSAPATASADGKHRHDLDTYKREAWNELLSTPGHNSLHVIMECDPGDYALDGMWKVDAHDGDDRSIVATSSLRSSSVKETWSFDLVNTGTGRAQIKTFITCLDSTTGERDGHAHQVLEGARHDHIVPMATDTTTLTASCLDGEIPVAPSFWLPAHSDARLVQSYPTEGHNDSDNVMTWNWTFYDPTFTGDNAIVSIYCLKRNTSAVAGHSHRIDADFLPRAVNDDRGLTVAVPADANGHSDFRIASRPHDEGNVGAFRINHYANIWYLGQDAQGQVRGFRFNNTGGAGTESVKLGVWGFDKRTKKNS